MSREELSQEINKLSGDELIALCNEIYDFKYSTGELQELSILKAFADKINYHNIRDIEDEVLYFCENKFQKTLLLLFSERPNSFLKRVH